VDGVCYTHHAEEVQFDFVISLRYPTLAREMLTRFPDARHLVWLHDLDPEGIVEFMAAMPCYAVCGSDYQRNRLREIAETMGKGITGGELHRIYNPIDDLDHADTAGVRVDP